MTFGEALEAVKTGKRITRDGWNGKNMFVFYAHGEVLFPELCDILAVQGITALIKIKTRPHLDMFTAQGDIQVGWLASQSDMLADDWRVLND